jgi:hypothetical protein
VTARQLLFANRHAMAKFPKPAGTRWSAIRRARKSLAKFAGPKVRCKAAHPDERPRRALADAIDQISQNRKQKSKKNKDR